MHCLVTPRQTKPFQGEGRDTDVALPSTAASAVCGVHYPQTPGRPHVTCHILQFANQHACLAVLPSKLGVHIMRQDTAHFMPST